MASAWTASRWVEQHRDEMSFALHVFPIDTPVDPAAHLLAAGRLAEDLGFDAFFVGDHPAWALDPWVHLAALAVTTRRIRLGVNVCCALYRHPVLTARLAADLDNLSNGRLILGLGNGWDANEFANLGLPFLPAPQRQAALAEAIEIIQGVWGDDPFSFDGQHFGCTGAHVSPLPVQRPNPPVIIAGSGERVTLRQVARSADACNIMQIDPFGSGLLTPEAVANKLAVLHRHCDEIGRPFDTVLRTYTTGWTILAKDEASLQAKLSHYFPEGVEQRYQGAWRDYVLSATPDEAIAHFRALVEPGIQYFIVETMDAMDHETIRLLANDVIPAINVTSSPSH